MHIRKMRNIAAGLLLAMALMVQLIPIGRAAGTELRITTPETVPKAGETFTVTVDISGNPGFGAVQFAVPYDSSVMTCTKASTGTLLERALTETNPSADKGAILVAISLDEIKGDGQLVMFTFTAKQDLASNDFSLSNIILADGNDVDISYTVTKSGGKDVVPQDPAEPSDKEPSNGTEQTPPKDQDKPEEDDKTSGSPVPPTATTSAFTDMAGHWAEADVKRAVELGVLNGYPDGTFKPDNSLTRAQFVTILWRQVGRPEVTSTTPFTDISGINQEFQTAIAWAYGKKLVDGTSPTTFNPNGTLSRQATMKILFQHNGGTAGAEQMFYSVYDETFPDSGQMASWAKTPMYWGVYHSLISDGAGESLNPVEPATRGQLARIIVRYIDKFGGDE